MVLYSPLQGTAVKVRQMKCAAGICEKQEQHICNFITSSQHHPKLQQDCHSNRRLALGAMLLPTLKSPNAGRLGIVAAGGYTSGSCLYHPLKSSCMVRMGMKERRDFK